MASEGKDLPTPEGKQPSKNTANVTQQISTKNKGQKNPCKFGMNCRNINNGCRFYHPPTLGPNNLPSKKELCGENLNCVTSDCNLFHNTPNTKSPAFNMQSSYPIQPSHIPIQPIYQPTGITIYRPNGQVMYHPYGQPMYHPNGQVMRYPNGQPMFYPDAQVMHRPNAQVMQHPNGQPMYHPNGQPMYCYLIGHIMYHPNGQPMYNPNGQVMYQPISMPKPKPQRNEDDYEQIGTDFNAFLQKKFKVDELLKQAKIRFPLAITKIDIKENDFKVELFKKDPNYNTARVEIQNLLPSIQYHIYGPPNSINNQKAADELKLTLIQIGIKSRVTFQLEPNYKYKNDYLLWGLQSTDASLKALAKQMNQYISKNHRKQTHLFIKHQQLGAEEKYYYYTLLKEQKLIEDILAQNEIKSKVVYDNNKKTITANISQIELNSVKVSLEKLISSLEIYPKTYQGEMNFFDQGFGQKFRQKIEEKLSIIIKPRVQIVEGSQGQMSGSIHSQLSSSHNKHKGQFYTVKDIFPQRQKYPSQAEYDIRIIGPQDSTEKAWAYIEEKLKQYKCQPYKLPLSQKIKSMFQSRKYNPSQKSAQPQNLDKPIKDIEEEFQCAIYACKDIIYIFGKDKGNIIQQAAEALKDLVEIKPENEQKVIPLQNAPNQQIKLLFHRNQLAVKKIEQELKVRIKCSEIEVSIYGKAQDMGVAFHIVTELIKSFEDSIKKVELIEKAHINAILKMKIRTVELKHGVQIIKEEQQDSQQQMCISFQQQESLDFNTPESSQQEWQWSYKSVPGDANYKQRQDTVNDFFDYDPDQNWQIEQLYQETCASGDFSKLRKIVGDAGKVQNGQEYQIKGSSSDPNTWSQTNIKTGFNRKLNRRENKEYVQPQPKKVEVQHISNEEAKQSSANIENEKWFLKGQQENIDTCMEDLKLYCKNPQNYKEYLSVSNQFQSKNALLIKECQNIVKAKHQCDIQIHNDDIIIIGFKGKDAKIELEKIFENAQKYSFPITWENTMNMLTSKDYLLKIALNQVSLEFINIETQFKTTLPKAQIITVDRIQNRKLWKTYQSEMENISEKHNGQIVEEMNLYHGTRTSDPLLIYDGEEGFDMRYSASGMWGQGVYFAVNSSYSDAYAYKTKDGVKQMFYAKVQVGMYKQTAPDGSIRMPPLMDGSQLRYDSVKGHTGGSDVYMIYTNKKAYPEYLITYK